MAGNVIEDNEQTDGHCIGMGNSPTLFMGFVISSKFDLI